MKNTNQLITLILAAGFPCVALAQIAGVPVPAAINTESTLAAFAIVGITLIAVRDYARPFRPLLVDVARSGSSAPTVVLHRPAYGIRRGAEVARLAA
jgi:hypothetical protein